MAALATGSLLEILIETLAPSEPLTCGGKLAGKRFR